MVNRIGRVCEPFCLDFIKREIVPLSKKQVLIEIKASCICGSDLHIYKGKHPAVTLPVTIGHEFSGKVLEVGAEVTKWKKGDRVVIEPVIACKECEACRRGEYGYCENISFTYRCGDGAMAKYFVGSEESLYRLPAKVSYEAGAMAEPLAVAVHAVKRAEIKLGDKVAVIGAGAIGILIGAISRKLGAKEVVISDYSKFRLRMAKKLGATRTVYAKEENLETVVAEMSEGKGFEKAFECVGLEQTFRQAMNIVKTNGLVTDVGIFEKTDIVINASLFVKKELRIQGAQGYCWDFEDAIDLLQALPLEQLITHYYSLDELETAMKMAMDTSGEAIKVCIRP